MKYTASHAHALPIGTRLQEYTIKRVLSLGGFSYVYLAQDSQRRSVAIKEYMPIALAERIEDGNIRPKQESALAFKHGMKCFFDEGLALANIEHHNIVRVQNFFRAHQTVYMVMQYERGKSLQDVILALKHPLPEKYVIRMFVALLQGLREVHSRKLLHLDIKPANIYLRVDGSPVLLDFGSARQALSEMTLAPSFTPGFASPEQYYDRKHLGPWSDIYSIGASLYACLCKCTPQPASQRLAEDTLVPAVTLGQGIYSQHLLKVIDQCLQIDYLMRPQSVFALQKQLQDVPEVPVEITLMERIIHVLMRPL